MGSRPDGVQIAFENAAGSSSEASQVTLERVFMRRRRGWRPREGAKHTFYDNTNVQYSWLLPGWLAEERRMKSGRLYKYYFDPLGQMYNSQHEVLNAFEESGVVVLDL